LAHDLFRKPVPTFQDHARKKVATLNMGSGKGQCERREVSPSLALARLRVLFARHRPIATIGKSSKTKSSYFVLSRFTAMLY
jgi:hypothetical protein